VNPLSFTFLVSITLQVRVLAVFPTTLIVTEFELFYDACIKTLQRLALLKAATQHRAEDLRSQIPLCLCRSVKSVPHGTTSLALHLGSLCNSRKSCNVHHCISQQLDSVSTSFCIPAIYIDGVYAHGLDVDNENLYKSQHLPNRSSL